MHRGQAVLLYTSHVPLFYSSMIELLGYSFSNALFGRYLMGPLALTVVKWLGALLVKEGPTKLGKD